MKRLIVILVILAVITLSAAMAQTRWQYGLLSLSSGATWSTTELGVVRGDTYEEFYTALTGAEAPAAVQDLNVAILDLLGSFGWELVTRDGSFLILKRPIP